MQDTELQQGEDQLRLDYTIQSPQERTELVAKIVETFGTKEDFAVAEIMAKSDYMNVNDGFHLSRARSRVKGDGLMSETEFDDFMNSSFEKIEKTGTRHNQIKCPICTQVGKVDEITKLIIK